MHATPGDSRRPDARLDESLSLAEAVRFIERHWLLMLAGPLLLAVLVLIALVFVLPPEYVTAATLVVMPPPVSSDLQPQVLSVHGFKTLLESTGVVQATQRRLVEEGVLEPDDTLELHRDLEVRIFVSRREGTELAPMLEAVGRAKDPQVAAALANTWAAVLLERVQEVVERATQGGVAFVEAEYPKTQEQLQQQEAELVALRDEFQLKYQEVANRGDRRIYAFSKQMADRIAQQKAESRSIIETTAQEGLTTPSEGVAAKLADLAGLRAQMAQTTALLVLEKAISDDVLWEAQMMPGMVDADLSQGLLTQETNPVYQDLALQSVRVEGELKRAAGSLLGEVSAVVRELERLQQERSAGLSKLEAERSLELTVLQRRNKRELDTLERAQDLELDQIRRRISQLSALELKLARNYSEAILAKSQERVDAIYLASPAVAMDTPEEAGIALKTLAALILGGLLGLAASVVREVHARYRVA